MNIKRCKINPIVKIGDVKPSNEKFKVIGAFNPGATKYGNEIILAFRVAETYDSKNKNFVKVTFIDSKKNILNVVTLDKSDKKYDFSDPRVIRNVNSRYDFEYLTSISHVRLARSVDGVNFKVDDKPFIFPDDEYESFGIEDPRITNIGDKYYITYSAVSKYGIVAKLAVTQDFRTYRKLGNIFNTENKDVVIFPEKIGNKYFSLNRPVSRSIGKPVIWISESNNLIYWGNHKVLAYTREKCWDSEKIGAGIPPIKTNEGWLELYHGVDNKQCYSMGALLLDINDPSKIIGRSKEPILYPTKDYEKNGFFSDVVFPCGAVKIDNKLYIYYGASDNSIGLAIADIGDILSTVNI